MSKTWIVIGDSIMSFVADGVSRQHALTLVQNERDVIFKNIGSPGATMGATDGTGFNSDQVLDTINRISGFFGSWDGVIVQAGTNDHAAGKSLDDVSNSLRRILGHVRAKGKKALVLDLIWRAGENDQNSTGNNLHMYRLCMAIVAKYEFPDCCTFISRTGTPLDVQSDNYAAAEVAAGKQLHPNATGHRIMADWIKTAAATAGYF